MPKDDLTIKAWTDLCESCLVSFRKWQCAPNPGAWANPRVQANPQLLAFLASCRVTGPSPEAWRQTISEQLLLIRRICTDNKDGSHEPVLSPSPEAAEKGAEPGDAIPRGA